MIDVMFYTKVIAAAVVAVSVIALRYRRPNRCCSCSYNFHNGAVAAAAADVHVCVG